MEENSITLTGGVWSLDGKEELIEELSALIAGGERPPSAGADGDAGKEEHDLGSIGEGASSSQSIGKYSVDDSQKNGSCVMEDSVDTTQNGFSTASGDVLSSDTGEAVDDEGRQSTKWHDEKTANGTPVLGLDAALKNGSKRACQEQPCSSASSSKRLKADYTVEVHDPESYSGIVPPSYLLPKARLAHALGRRLAARLLAAGAAKILAEAKAQNTVTAPNVNPAQQ